MTTQITTLEQAENHLYRSFAVALHDGEPMVEGKKLLEVCGFSYTGTEGRDNSKRVLDRQIAKHTSFEEGVDFTVTLDGDGRIRRSVYHFTVNAANHILLAAMTPEGRTARQEAIDMRVEQQSQAPVVDWAQLAAVAASLVPATANLLSSVNDVQSRVTTVEGELGDVREQVEELYSNDVPAGCLSTREQIKPDIAPWLSEEKIRSALKNSGWPFEEYTRYIEGTKVASKAYYAVHPESGMSLEDFFLTIKFEAIPVSAVFYVHQLINGKFRIL